MFGEILENLPWWCWIIIVVVLIVCICIKFTYNLNSFHKPGYIFNGNKSIGVMNGSQIGDNITNNYYNTSLNNSLQDMNKRKYYLYSSCNNVLKELDRCNQLTRDECIEQIEGVSLEEVFVELESEKAAERFNGGLRRCGDNTHRIFVSNHYEDLSKEYYPMMSGEDKPRNPIGFM